MKKVKKSSSQISRFDFQIDTVNWDKVEKLFSEERKGIVKELKNCKSLIDPRTKDILFLLAGGAVFGLSLMMPTLPLVLAPFLIDKSKYKQSLFGQTIKRLRKQKLIEVVYIQGEPIVQITEKGRVRALQYKVGEMQIKKPKQWDKKWRLVIFDIPERYKRAREIFRHHLKMMAFYQLQKSVWVHPYPCFDEVEFLRQLYGVGIHVTYVVAEKIEDVDYLKQRYEL